jgi:hypothetical protein
MAFPNVPFVPGVPAVPRPPGFVQSSLSLLVNDTIQSFLTNIYALQWGIWKDGNPIIIPNSIISLDFKKDYTISSYPVEGGFNTGGTTAAGFQSYDKVQTPFEARVRMSFSSGISLGPFLPSISGIPGTGAAGRAAFLNTLEAIAGDLNLYDVVTPEKTYESANIHHYDYQRTAVNGAGMIVVDVWLTQVVQVSTTVFSNTQNPGSADPISGGQVEAKPPGSNLPTPPLLGAIANSPTLARNNIF